MTTALLVSAKGENDRRKYFMIKSPQKNVADPAHIAPPWTTYYCLLVSMAVLENCSISSSNIYVSDSTYTSFFGKLMIKQIVGLLFSFYFLPICHNYIKRNILNC